MSHKYNKLHIILDDQRAKYIADIIGFFQGERDEEIGVIAAEKVFDFFMNTLGQDLYKKAIVDYKRLLNEKMEDLDIDLDTILSK